LGFDNPSLTGRELRRASDRSGGKRLKEPVRLLFVGRVDAAKGADAALAAALELQEAGADVRLAMAGDGPARTPLAALAAANAVPGTVAWHGWLTREDLEHQYEEAHFLVLPSQAEGFPKVIAEAMAHGVVPVVSAVSNIPEVLAETGCGTAVPPGDSSAFAAAISAYIDDPTRWQAESERGRKGAERFSYERYLGRIRAEVLGELEALT
jgi:glycosyltransferase involved in cell wall biosynthesis